MTKVTKCLLNWASKELWDSRTRSLASQFHISYLCNVLDIKLQTNNLKIWNVFANKPDLRTTRWFSSLTRPGLEATAPASISSTVVSTELIIFFVDILKETETSFLLKKILSIIVQWLFVIWTWNNSCKEMVPNLFCELICYVNKKMKIFVKLLFKFISDSFFTFSYNKYP